MNEEEFQRQISVACEEARKGLCVFQYIILLLVTIIFFFFLLFTTLWRGEFFGVVRKEVGLGDWVIWMCVAGFLYSLISVVAGLIISEIIGKMGRFFIDRFERNAKDPSSNWRLRMVRKEERNRWHQGGEAQFVG
jgi:hypothetical protein